MVKAGPFYFCVLLLVLQVRFFDKSCDLHNYLVTRLLRV